MSDEVSEAERKVMDPLLRKINGAPEGEREHSRDHPQACLNQRFPWKMSHELQAEQWTSERQRLENKPTNNPDTVKSRLKTKTKQPPRKSLSNLWQNDLHCFPAMRNVMGSINHTSSPAPNLQVVRLLHPGAVKGADLKMNLDSWEQVYVLAG